MDGMHFSYRIAVMGALLIVALAVAGRPSLWSASEVDSIGRGNPSFQELSDRFTKLAQQKGAVYAFGVLKKAAVPPGIDMHLLGHVVGDILYKQEGINGVKECTQDFRNACSHSIVIGVLNEFATGDATIAKIRAACKLAPGGSGAYTMCFHGLGHGVFAYFGYDLPKAVAFCKRLGTAAYGNEEYTQCVGGMIMELVDGGGHDHDAWVSANETYLDPRDPLAPCDRSLIPYDAKSFCYMYLTPHLFAAAGADLAHPDPVTFPKAFSYCSAIADTRLRDACSGSFGKEFIPLAAARDIRSIDQMSDTEYLEAIEWCSMAPKTEGQNSCVAQALASVFWGGENDPNASFRFCSLVSDSSAQTTCYTNLGENIASYTSGSARSTLCAQLPTRNQNQCKNADVVPQDKP